MDLELAGRVALVTGATRGIGRAIAARLADEGCAVAICARDADAVAQTVAALEAQGGKAFGHAVDVTDDAALEAFVDAAARDARRPRPRRRQRRRRRRRGPPRRSTTGDDWRRTMELNVVHAAVLVRAAVPHLRARGGGAALVIASISGITARSPKAQYAAAKAAEIHLAVSLGRELGPDRIRVNALSPGSILFEGGSWDRRRIDDPGRVRRVRQDRVPPRAPRHRRGDRRRRRVPPVAARELGQRHRAHRRRRSEPARDGRMVSPLARVPDPVVMGVVNVTPGLVLRRRPVAGPGEGDRACAQARGRRRGHPRHRRRVDAAGREPGGRRRAAAAHRARVRGSAGRRGASVDRHDEGARSPRRRSTRAPTSSTTSPPCATTPISPACAPTAACNVCLMHMLGEPRTMQDDPHYDDVVDDVKAFLVERLAQRGRRGHRARRRSGSTRGSGSARPSTTTSRSCGAWTSSSTLGRPIVVGTSRKGFIGRISGEEVEGRVPGTIATNVIALGNGAEVFRVHDVAAVAQALDVAAATLRGQWNGATTTSTTSTRTTS